VQKAMSQRLVAHSDFTCDLRAYPPTAKRLPCTANIFIPMEKEMINRNIELSAEFSRFLFDHPEFEEKIPLGAEIIFLPEFDPELKTLNLDLGKKLETSGERVVYIKIQRLNPRPLSRIEGISLESASRR